MLALSDIIPKYGIAHFGSAKCSVNFSHEDISLLKVYCFFWLHSDFEICVCHCMYLQDVLLVDFLLVCYQEHP